jgi:tetratricopeptide (TPR) repeat protein
VRLKPYEQDHADALLAHFADRGGHGLAQGWLAAHGMRYPEAFRQRWRARLLMQDARWDDALAELGPPLTDDDPREALTLELEVHRLKGDLAAKRARIEEGLARFPEDPYLHHLLAVTAGEGSPEALDLYARSLSRTPTRGAIDELLEHSPAEVFIARVEQALRDARSAERRRELVEVAHDALERAGRLELCCDLLERIVRDAFMAEDRAVLELLVRSQLALGRCDAATPHTRRLLQLDPELPSHVWLAARALEPTRPAEARPLYERYLQLTADPQAHTALAACHQALGDRRAAIDGYWKSLARRAGDPIAVANLHLLGERGVDLLDHCRRALSEPPTGDVQHFAVAAVDIAITHGEPLAVT